MTAIFVRDVNVKPSAIIIGSVAIVVASLVIGCHRGNSGNPPGSSAATVRSESSDITFSCWEENGATLSIAIRGDRAVLAYTNADAKENRGSVVIAPQQYLIRIDDRGGEYRIDRVNAASAFWFRGRAAATVGSGKCKPVSRMPGA